MAAKTSQQESNPGQNELSCFEAFRAGNFYTAMQQLFATDLNVPMHFVPAAALRLEDIVREHFRPNARGHQMAEATYFLGLVDDMAFAGARNPRSVEQLQRSNRQYQGLAIFGVELSEPKPRRSDLTDVIRALNRSFLEMPVVVIFSHGGHISLAAIERRGYKQEWREGEKMGKVFLLQDIDLHRPHAGHSRILQQMRIPRMGKDAVRSYEELYAHWQRVLSVSILNREFYKELQAWFFWAVEKVEFPEGGEPDREKRNAVNVIRLLTRLIFVWFLKERKLVPEVLFDETALKEVLNWKDKTGSTYYKAILQNLFFATLNTERDVDLAPQKPHRVWVETQYGVQGYYRYKRFFRSPEAVMQLFRNIPFLNGGLFENLDRNVGEPKEIRVDCFSNRLDNEALLKFPDALFFGEADVDQSKYYDGKKGKPRTEHVRGLIHILNRYKFTVTENTPFDQEVALDPELLGKVFENLLAAYNPETKTTARNQTGSFYTPREIVDFMVDESLLAHLLQRLPKATFSERPDLEQDLRALLRFGTLQPFDTVPEREAIIHCLSECKIIDPACGSGAYPMGILQKMVHVLGKLDPDNALWKAEQIAKARRELEEDLQLANQFHDDEIRKRAENDLDKKLNHIEENFDEKENELGFARKLYLIENCIYGVDIQPIATQISKLRFFISLLVDQKPNDERPNRGIIPLPNLETKFVAADSLIGLERPAQQRFRKPEIEKLEAELNDVRRQYFKARQPFEKRREREKDYRLRERIAQLLIDENWGDKIAKQIANWDMYDQNTSASFFDSEWMYGIKARQAGGGFDIVIGNPPYVQIQSFSGKPIQKAWEAQRYETFVKTGDIYSLFYEQGWRLLKERGALTFITSNKWMRAGYGESTRNFFATKTDPKILIDFGMAQVFDAATTYTSIVLFQKGRNGKLSTKACRIEDNFERTASLPAYFEANHSVVTDYGKEAWVAYTAMEYAIKRTVEGQGKALNLPTYWEIEINYGIKTGNNDAFVISRAERDRLIAEDLRNEKILKPLLRGRDVRRWYPGFEEQWLVGTFPALNIDIDKYPILKAYLERDGQRKKLEPKPRDFEGAKWEGRKQGSYQWFETQDSIGYWREFEKPKIIYPNMTKYLPFCYDEGDHFYCNDKSFLITGKRIKFLTAVFNSALFYFCFKDNFPELLGETYEVRKIFLEKIPIKVPTPAEEAPLSRMTEYLSYCHRNAAQHKEALLMAMFLDRLADALVYELYFEEKFAAAGKALRNTLGELPAVTDMKDMGHFADIRKVWQRLSDPDHQAAYVLATMNEIPEVALMEETNRRRSVGGSGDFGDGED